MKIAHIISASEDKLSGPKNSVSLLAKYLNKNTKSFNVVYSIESKHKFKFNGVDILPINMIDIKYFDFIIINGVYDFGFMKIARLARRFGVRYIFMPRASFMIRSISKSFYKKIPFLIVNLRNMFCSSAFFFLTDEEKAGSFFGSNKKSFVCGNIVDDFPRNFLEDRDKVIRFIGRFDINHKGLDFLIDAVYLSCEKIREYGWEVHLHGPEFHNGKSTLENKVDKLGMRDIVFFHDEVYEAEKKKLLNRSSIFVHTSRYEGQPQAVMESMAHGNAILITPGTNMASIVKSARCGKVSILDSREIAKSLIELISLPSSDLKALQINSFVYASNNFTGYSVSSSFIKILNEL